MDINQLIKKAHENAMNKGFWDDKYDLLNVIASIEISKKAEIFHRTTLLALIITELSEAIEALRHGDWENHDEELADVLIRLCDYCGGYQVDLEAAARKKMEINKNRPQKHGKNF